jgi:DNA-binding MarR family transcriptional regulator
LPARLGHPDGRSALSESYDGDKTKLSPRQHRVLAAICAAPRGLPCEALPEQVGMNPRDVATIVAGLVDAGAIHQGTVNGAPVYKWGYRA